MTPRRSRGFFVHSWKASFSFLTDPDPVVIKFHVFIRKKNPVSDFFVNLISRRNKDMQNIQIDCTSNTPMVKFDVSGILMMKGRSLILDGRPFYQPLIDWASALDAETVIFNIDFDYFNSSSSKLILELLKIIDINARIKTFNVNWYFETDDEDILEIGQIFEERLQRARFFYREHSESGCVSV
jgi:hypothetical protein